MHACVYVLWRVFLYNLCERACEHGHVCTLDAHGEKKLLELKLWSSELWEAETGTQARAASTLNAEPSLQPWDPHVLLRSLDITFLA